MLGRVSLLAASAALISSACGGEATKVRVVGLTRGGHAPMDVALGSLDDLSRVEGARARTLGGGRLDLRYDAWPPDSGGARDEFVEAAHPVSVGYAVDGEVAVADDFDGLSMYSTYVHLEAASDYFALLGAACATDQVLVYYHPRFDRADTDNTIRSDNAAYIPEIDALAFFPMQILQDIPFAMNPGVVAHEYAHRIAYCELWDASMFARFTRFGAVPGAQQTLNRVRATDEGMADFFGAATSGDPAFLRHSLPAELAAARDLTVERVLAQAWLSGDEPVTQDERYDPYAAGAVAASTLWAFAEIAGHAETAAAVIGAQRRVGAQLDASFTYRFGDLEAAVIEALPAGARAELCTRAARSYAAAWSAFAGTCP